MNQTNHTYQRAEVGTIAGYRAAVETYRNYNGTYDVTALIYDTEIDDWMAIGNAEETNEVATEGEARRRGLEILHEEIALFLEAS